MKKKKVSLAILGVASLFATTFASAETKTFWQCMPIKKCPAGERQEGLDCKVCESNWFCPAAENSKSDLKSATNVKDRIKSLYLTKIQQGCKNGVTSILNYLTEQPDNSTRIENFYKAIKSLSVKIGYEDLAKDGGNAGPFINITNDTYAHLSHTDYETLQTNKFFEFDCMDVATSDMASLVTSEAKRLYTSFTKITSTYDTLTGDIVGFVKLYPGIYKVEVIGGGGGGGAGCTDCNGAAFSAGDLAGGDGGAGEKRIGYFAYFSSDPNKITTYSYKIGRGGSVGTKNGNKSGSAGGHGTESMFAFGTNVYILKQDDENQSKQQWTTGTSITANGGKGGDGVKNNGGSKGCTRGNVASGNATTGSTAGCTNGTTNPVPDNGCGGLGIRNDDGRPGGHGVIRIYKLQ